MEGLARWQDGRMIGRFGRGCIVRSDGFQATIGLLKRRR
jgi:hypothetical protein